MRRLLPDLRFAARMFARQPLAVAAALLTLALGISANSAIFPAAPRHRPACRRAIRPDLYQRVGTPR